MTNTSQLSWGFLKPGVSKLDNVDYSNTEYNFIPGFKEKTRLSVFVKKGLSYKIRYDIMSSLEILCVWLEMKERDPTTRINRLITVINIYREH